MAMRPVKASVSPAATAVVLATATFALAALSCGLMREFGRLAAVWPANAVVLAAMLGADRKVWRWQLVAGMVGVGAAYAVTGLAPWIVLGLPLCNAFDIWLCAHGLRHYLNRDLDLTRGRDLTLFLLVTGLVAPLVSALPATWVMSQAGHAPGAPPHLLAFAYDWLQSRSLGMIVFTPALVAIGPRRLADWVARQRLWRTAGLFGLLAVGLAVAFAQPQTALLFLILPILMLITVELDLAGGALAVVATAMAAIGHDLTSLGAADQSHAGLTGRMLIIQLFLAVATLSVLAASAVLGRQKRLNAALNEALTETETMRKRLLDEQRLAVMAEEIARVGHWRWDRASGQMTWSSEVFRIFGRDPTHAAPDLAAALAQLRPTDRATIGARLATMTQDGVPVALDLGVTRPDGQQRFVTAHCAAERDAQGALSAVFGALIDVTEARRALEKLQASEAGFRRLAEKSDDVFLKVTIDTDFEFRMAYVNPAIEKVLGYRPDDYLNADTMAFVHPDDLAALQQSNSAQMLEGPNAPSRRNTFRAQHRDGHWVWLEGRPTFEFDPESGLVCGSYTVLRDVSANMLAQEALQASEARYRLMAANTIDAIVQLDPAGLITFVSPACKAVLGLAPEALIGADLYALMHAKDADRIRRLMARQAEAGAAAEPVTLQYRLRHGLGHWVWIEGRPKFIFDLAGKAIASQDALRDITARKAIELELSRARRAADAATVAKSDFLGAMSHEIRTPLTAIIGFAGLLDGFDGLPAQARSYVQRVISGGQTLMTVINDVLDFSKLESRQIVIEAKDTVLRDVIDQAVAEAAPQAAKKGLTLTVDYAAEAPHSVCADGARLRQVLANLLNNAVKFTAEGGVTVSVGHIAEPGQLRIVVADTGVGIAANKFAHLFDRFSQIDSRVCRQYGGMGLGLAICKDLVALMGGEITVESTPGVGSRFSFTLDAPALAPALDASPAVAAERARPAQVLVVDDLGENRELVRMLLETEGHAIEEACGGEEAVVAAGLRQYDLILMDLQMPGTDGVAATQRIREAAGPNQSTPIVALTANALAEHADQCRAAGMNDHIAKPFRPDELVAKVTYWTARGAIETAHESRAVA